MIDYILPINIYVKEKNITMIITVIIQMMKKYDDFNSSDKKNITTV